MNRSKIYKTIFLFLPVFLLVALGLVSNDLINFTGGDVRVTYLDVGQGDATLIELPRGHRLLIDTGPYNNVLRPLAEQMPFGKRSLDAIFLTHFDADHTGGLLEILRRYKVDKVLITGEDLTNSVYKEFLEEAKLRGVKVQKVTAGDYVVVGPAMLQVLFPTIDATGWETNDMSAIIKLSVGENSFLFTGDAPKSIEEYLVKLYGSGLKSTVLKIGHHGSKNSSSEYFLADVAPDYSIISAGLNNRYGHPHKEVLDELNNLKEKIFGTFKDGSVGFTVGEGVLRVER